MKISELKEAIESIVDIGRQIKSVSDAVRKVMEDAIAMKRLIQLDREKAMEVQLYSWCLNMVYMRLEIIFHLQEYLKWSSSADLSKETDLDIARAKWRQILGYVESLDEQLGWASKQRVLKRTSRIDRKVMMNVQKLMAATKILHSNLRQLEIPSKNDEIQLVTETIDALNVLRCSLEETIETYDWMGQYVDKLNKAQGVPPSD
jgi:hypothetical protein